MLTPERLQTAIQYVDEHQVQVYSAAWTIEIFNILTEVRDSLVEPLTLHEMHTMSRKDTVRLAQLIQCHDRGVLSEAEVALAVREILNQ